MAQVKVKNSSPADRDIRYEACLQVAIGNYGKFIKDGERALEVLQATLKKPSVVTVSAAATSPVVERSAQPIGLPSPSSSDKKIKSPISEIGSGDLPRSKKKVKPAEAAPKLPADVSNGHNPAKFSSGVQSSRPEAENRQMNSPRLESDGIMMNSAEPVLRPVAVNPDDLANRAVALARNKDEASLKQAILLFTEAIKLNPQHAGYYGNRSLCFHKLQDFSSSLNDAALALQFAPDNAKYLRWKAMALIGLKRYSEAAETAKMILELVPGDERALEIESEARRNMRSSPKSAPQPQVNDPVDVAIVSRLPKKITAEGIRDLICGLCEASLARPVHFLVGENQPYTTGVVFLVDVEGAQRVAEKLQNYPFGIHRVRVELVKRSYAETLALSMSPPDQSSADSSSSEASSSSSSEDEIPPNRPATGGVVLRPQSSALSISSDSSSTPQFFLPGSSNGTPSQAGKTQSTQPKIAAPNEVPRACSVFVGNVPSDTEINEIAQLVHERIPSIGMRFTVVKKTAWDYCFVNLQSSQDAELVAQGLHKARFGPVVLDANLQMQAPPTSAVVRTSSLTDNPNRASPSPTPSSCTSIYLSNLPTNMALHEILNEIYIAITPVIKSDFALYKQTQWRHCFLNFETSWAAESAIRCLQQDSFRLGSTFLQAKLTESKTVAVASTHQGYNDFVMSLSMPSQWLRLDNLDGACNDTELRELCHKNAMTMSRETDFSVAYLRFVDVQSAAACMNRLQGVIVRRSALAVRYAIPRK